MNDRSKAAIFLVIFAPIVGEGISGSTPVMGFLNPVTLILLISLYGIGALLIREYLVSDPKTVLFPWKTLLLLGAFYGITEEGYILWSFFNPAWPDLGVMAVYGRIAGINLVWVVFLTIFHMWFSISVPIIFTHLLFPSTAFTPYLSHRGRRIALLIFICQAFIWILYVMTTYSFIPPLPQYILFVFIGAVLLLTARKTHVKYGRKEIDEAFREKICKSDRAPTGGARFFIGGLIFPATVFLSVYLMPLSGIPWWICAFWLAIVTYITLHLLLKSGDGIMIYSARNVWLFASGSLIWLLYFLSINDPFGFLVFTLTVIILIYAARPRKKTEYFGVKREGLCN